MTGHRIYLPIFATIILLVGALAQQPATTPIPGLPAPPTAPLTVDDAVAFALRNNPTIARSDMDVRIAEAQVTSAQAGRRPTVSVASTTTYNPSPASITIPGGNQSFKLGDTLTSGIAVTGTQPVWPSTRWKAPVAAAQAGVGVSETTLARNRQQIAFQVRQAYFQLLSAQQLQQVADDAVKVAETQLKLAQNTFEAGTAPKLDVVQATAGLESARVDQLRAQNATAIANSVLAVQLGLPAGTPFALAPPKTLPAAPSAVEPMVETALTQRTELTELNYRRQQLQANVELIKLQQKPLVNVAANFGDTLIGSGGLTGGQGFTVSLTAALAVYNGGKTKADLDAARLQLEQFDLTAKQVELGITLDVRQASLNLQSALAQLTAAQRQLDAATQALEIAQVRYDYGEGIFLEVEQARLRQTQARTALAQAQFQANVAAAQLDLAVGTPVAAPK